MKKTLKMALELADSEAKTCRTVMVLVPDVSWVCGLPWTTSPKGSHGTVHIRCTVLHSGLKMVPIDTLILVASDSPSWDAEGEAYARERLKASLDPRVIEVGDDSAAPDVCFDCGKQRNPYSSESHRWVLVHSRAERCCMKCSPKHRERWIR